MQAPLPLGDSGGLAVEIPVTDVVLGPCTGLVGGEVVAWVPQRTVEDQDPAPAAACAVRASRSRRCTPAWR